MRLKFEFKVITRFNFSTELNFSSPKKRAAKRDVVQLRSDWTELGFGRAH